MHPDKEEDISFFSSLTLKLSEPYVSSSRSLLGQYACMMKMKDDQPDDVVVFDRGHLVSAQGERTTSWSDCMNATK